MTLRAAFISSFFLFFFVLCLFGRIVRSPIGSNRWNDKKTLNKKFVGGTGSFLLLLSAWLVNERGEGITLSGKKQNVLSLSQWWSLSLYAPTPPLIWFVVSLSTLSISKTVPGCLFSFDSIAWALTLLSKMINAARNVHEEMEGKNKKKIQNKRIGSTATTAARSCALFFFFQGKTIRKESRRKSNN